MGCEIHKEIMREGWLGCVVERECGRMHGDDIMIIEDGMKDGLQRGGGMMHEEVMRESGLSFDIERGSETVMTECGLKFSLERGCEMIVGELGLETGQCRGYQMFMGEGGLKYDDLAREYETHEAKRESWLKGRCKTNDRMKSVLERGCEANDRMKSGLERGCKTNVRMKSGLERGCETHDGLISGPERGRKMGGENMKEDGLKYDLERGSEMHGEMMRECGFKCDLFLGCALVDMYSKCGILTKAQEVFSMLPIRNTATWNAIISGYVRNGRPEAAFGFFDKMQIEGISPDSVTFTSILKGCSDIVAINKGKEIHADIDKRGLLKNNPFVGTALIDMYSKCGMLADARLVLVSHSCRNVATYTALISGYLENEFAEKALECYGEMKKDNIVPNTATYACCLRACGMINGGIEKGRLIDAEITNRGLCEKDISVGNALVDMYAKCGMLEKARFILFDRIPIPNSITWNSLMAGYVQNGHCKEALNCFNSMQTRGSMPDAVTFTCCLRACGALNDLEKGAEIHAQIVRNGLLGNEVSVGNALVDMYAKSGWFIKAKEVLNSLSFRDVSTWNSLITSYAQCNCAEDVLKCYKEMQLDGVNPNAITYACGLKACVSMGDIDKGSDLHCETVERGLFTEDMVIGSTLIDMYAKCGMLLDAQKVFDMLPVRDVVTWTSLMSGYEQHGCGEEALDCFEKMQLEGLSPNSFTYACGLKACGRIGAMDKGEEILAEVNRKGLLKTNIIVGSAVVDMYAKCGSLRQAKSSFDMLPNLSSITWNALITGYAQVGEVSHVFHLLERMIMEGNEPDIITFLNVVNVCSHAGLVDEGQICFKIMREKYQLTPTLRHFTCIVDLLGRAGQLDEVLTVATETPFHIDIAMWLAILGACRKWGNVELARHAFEHATLCHGYQASAYVCMLNVYANVGGSQ